MALGWPPDVYWRSTMVELLVAVDGYKEAHGIQDAARPMTMEEAQELFDRFPDRPARSKKRG